MAKRRLIKRGTVRLLVQASILTKWICSATSRYLNRSIRKWSDFRVANCRHNFLVRKGRIKTGARPVISEEKILRFVGRTLPVNLGPSFRLQYDDLRQIVHQSCPGWTGYNELCL